MAAQLQQFAVISEKLFENNLTFDGVIRKIPENNNNLVIARENRNVDKIRFSHVKIDQEQRKTLTLQATSRDRKLKFDCDR